MTHFAVAVISDGTKTVDELLLPYMENCCGEPPKEFMEFYEDDECSVDPETGLRGYWQNPNAKWDWWVLGGRWRGMLRATEGELGEPSWCNEKTKLPAGRFDSAQIKNIDFTSNQEVYDRAIAEWEYNIEGKGDDENLKWWCSTDYMVKHYGSKEAYAEIESTVFWRAVVTPDGEWHEVGTTGWFGAYMESREQYADWALHFKERFIDPCDPECTIFVCDCHI